jgi:hypothetical protein
MIHVVPASSLTVFPKSGATEVNPSHLSLKWKSQSGVVSHHVMVAYNSNFTKVVTNQTVFSTKLNVDTL